MVLMEIIYLLLFFLQMITRDMFEDALKDLSDDGIITLTGRATIRVNTM